MSPFSLDKKVILVTGGIGFMGAQFVPYLEKLGAKVYILDKKHEPSVDITNAEEVKSFVSSVLDKEGKIDALLHAAGLDAVPGDSDKQFAPYEHYALDVWERAFEVNLTAAQIVTQAVAPHMMKAKSGSIVFMASDLALIAPNNTIYDEGRFKDIAYVSSKAGMLGLMRAWASYLGPHNVRANAFVPGGMRNTHTDEFAKKNGALNMMGRMAEKGEYNATVAFLLSDASPYMTGASIVVDGGRTAW
jgi:NAD(P)-dependent dehydrogenase (short-subunit alcohol dehydrogenase family)